MIENLSEIMIADLGENCFEDLKEVYFGRVRYPKSGTHGPRIQRGIQLFHLLSGEVVFEIEGRVVRLQAGDMCLLLPGRHEFHRFSEVEESQHAWCQLDFHEPAGTRFEPLARVSEVVQVNPDLERFMELGLSLTRTPDRFTAGALLTLGQSLLHYYVAYAQQTSVMGAQDKPIPKAVRVACDYMSQHLQSPLTLEDVAQASFISVNHLIVLFRQHLGLTPSRYLWRLRTQQAAMLLRSTMMPLAQIAEQTGFSSPFHFSRAFKERYQESPKSYRQRKTHR